MATTYGGRTRPISITLPNAMLGEIDRACKAGHYTRSEYIREILRTHLFVQNTPAEKATAEEVRSMRAGRREIEQGEFVTLADLEHDLDTDRRKPRTKKLKRFPADVRNRIIAALKTFEIDRFWPPTNTRIA